MHEFTCAYCGKVKRVLRECDVGRFCSKSCAARWGNEQRYGKKEPEPKFREPRLPEPGECIYQPESVLCDRKICSKCGWNPEVAKARLEAITGKVKEV